jgi:hypothetical protein
MITWRPIEMRGRLSKPPWGAALLEFRLQFSEDDLGFLPEHGNKFLVL